MTTSADLGIYYLAGQQAQPEIIHNSALNQFQMLLSGVISVGLNTPPGSPAQGDTYILGASPTGAWAGRANCLAGYFGTGWVFVPGNDSAGTPIAMGVRQEGLRAWNKSDDKTYVWTGSAWAIIVSGMTNPMTTSGDIIYGGASGTPTRLAPGSNGQFLALAGGVPSWITAGQSGIASALASGDVFPMFESHGSMGAGGLNSTTRLQFHVARLDAAITITDVVLAVVAASASQTIDVSIYEFLGCGKPGLCLAKGQISTTATGKILGTVGTPVTLQPGLYFVAVHGTSTSPTFAIGSASVQNMRHVPLLITNGFEYMAVAGNHYESALVTDTTLPGGAYTFGMNLTGFTMSSTSILGFNSTIPLVGVKKQ